MTFKCLLRLNKAAGYPHYHFRGYPCFDWVNATGRELEIWNLSLANCCLFLDQSFVQGQVNWNASVLGAGESFPGGRI